MIFGREPALWLAGLQMAIALAVGFGLKMSAEQVALILGFAAAVCGIITRQAVTPNAKVNTTTTVTNTLKVIVVALLLSSVLLVRPAIAGPPHQVVRDGVTVTEPDSTVLAWWRTCGYVTAGAASFGRDVDGAASSWTSFFPGAGVSYTWTDELSTAINGEEDLARKVGMAAIGVRMRTYHGTGDNPLDVYLGIDYVWATRGARDALAWEHKANPQLSIRLAVPAIKRHDDQHSTAAFVVASARFTPDEKHARPYYTIGVRPTLFGGRW